MDPPLIAIVGSMDPQRTDYEPPLEQVSEAAEAARQLGQALAQQGCRLVVYSSAAYFIESQVVAGFVQCTKVPQNAIEVRFPTGATVDFTEWRDHPDLFYLKPDPQVHWEASFYRSLKEVHGIVLIGGGRSTYITGQVALAYETPLLALATFGGSAKKVWQGLRPNAILHQDDIDLMGQPSWQPGQAERCVKALFNQYQRRVHLEAQSAQSERRKAWGKGMQVIVALLLLLATVATIPLSLTNLGGLGTGLYFPFLLFFAPVLGGGAGSAIRLLWEPYQGFSRLETLVLGAAAGAAGGILYLISQLTTNMTVVLGESSEVLGDVAVQRSLLVIVAVFIGFIAGFTFDLVYKKLKTLDALQAQSISAPKP